MSSAVSKKLNALIFIDTNIFLDFYRSRNQDVSFQYLSEIEKQKNLIITTSQVEMEFKKNRQLVLLSTMKDIKRANSVDISIPPILINQAEISEIRKSKKLIKDQQTKLTQLIENIFKDPLQFDPVYKAINTLFTKPTSINLHKENQFRYSIRKLALKRFILGYPPKKNNDNSIIDAINWEWIIKCAQTTGKHIIIVSRDSDFGATYSAESFINDWLKQEFKERITPRRQLILTDKLSLAFSLVEIPVSKEMVEEEERMLTSTDFTDFMPNLRKAIMNMNQALYNAQFTAKMENMNITLDNLMNPIKDFSDIFDNKIKKSR